MESRCPQGREITPFSYVNNRCKQDLTPVKPKARTRESNSLNVIVFPEFSRFLLSFIGGSFLSRKELNSCNF